MPGGAGTAGDSMDAPAQAVGTASAASAPAGDDGPVAVRNENEVPASMDGQPVMAAPAADGARPPVDAFKGLSLKLEPPIARAKSTSALSGPARPVPGGLSLSAMGISLPPSSTASAPIPRLGPMSPSGVGPTTGVDAQAQSRFTALTSDELATELRSALGLPTTAAADPASDPEDPDTATLRPMELPDDMRLLIIDVRAAEMFAKSHIVGSVNVCLPSTLLRRTSFGIEKLLQTLKTEAEKKAFNNLPGKTHVVLVDASSDRVTSDMPIALLLQKFAKEPLGAKLCWLNGGFAAFSQAHADLLGSMDTSQASTHTGKRPPSHLPAVAGAGAMRLHTPSTPGNRSKPILTAPAGFFPPHGGPSSEYQTHVDSAPEELKRMRIFNKEDRPNLPESLPSFLRDLLGEGEVTEKLKDKFKAIEAEEQKRFQASWRATSPSDPFSISVGIEMGYKNRYSNIWPYNANRVVLPSDATGCDYINASFIDVPSKPKAYICTQGPIPSTFPEFWLMVYETQARIILMLTLEEDHGRRQCHRYWPSNVDDVLDLGPYLSVQLIAENKIAPHLMARKFALHRRHDPPDPVETRYILQLQYLDWPDHGVPADAQKVIQFRELVDRVRVYGNKDVGTDVPLIVHCSAGCGRTGTFCTIDHVFDRLFGSQSDSKQLEKAGSTDEPPAASSRWYDTIDLSELATQIAQRDSKDCDPRQTADSDLVLDTVQHLRTQRLLMVQTYAQLAFCYEALLQKCLE